MELTKLTAFELAAGYRNRDFSCEEVVKDYLKNIKEKDQDLNAYITVMEEEALNAAKDVDRRFQNREDLDLLAGIPISIKDNISVKDVKMTCGSKMLENYIPPYDSVVTERIKNAKGIILGKVNLDEFAMGATTRTSYYGPTKNPRDLSLLAGGSSGGSAASVVGEEATLSVGTDTGGSIRQPSSLCGAVGMKPTYGSIPRYGISTMANTFDQPGAIGRDVADVSLLLRVLEGSDKRDATSVGNPGLQHNFDFSQKATDELKKLKIAVPKLYLEMDLEPRVMDEFKKSIEILKEQGATVETYDIESLQYVIETYHILANGEIAPNMARFDGLRYGHRTEEDYETIEEFYRKSRGEGFGDEVKRRIMIGTHILSLDLAEDYYYKALKVRGLIKRDMERMFKEYHLILCPTTPSLSFKVDQQISPVEIYQADLFTIPANMAGCPSISIPMPVGNDNLSVGIQMTGKRFKDRDLIKAALGFERSVLS
ncbi:MAG: Asp-tRNA(Asn)/Glu-tRNA(Gln) amidotransferase subunit GatA [Tissierellia bacterium]|nr:Asp-tRNA(Asn)/Glu-tRNA(Gln) amidotransferase subunit GatA [Tissierellia bacterium]